MRAFRLAYDGAPYHGFQRQPDVPTVEGALFAALARLDIHDPDESKPAGYSAAGRTDADVSARAQTIALDCPDWCSPAALNGELPDAIRAWAAADVSLDFHAGLAATRRTYVYHLHAPALDDDRLDEAVARLAGEYDFHNLTPDDDGTVRDVAIDTTRDGEFVTLTVAADGFPRQLVRRVVTLLAEVGAGDRPLAGIDRLLGPEPVDGTDGVAPAPAHALVLADVTYDVAFSVDEAAALAARRVFESSRAAHLARARVAGTILDGLCGDSLPFDTE